MILLDSSSSYNGSPSLNLRDLTRTPRLHGVVIARHTSELHALPSKASIGKASQKEAHFCWRGEGAPPLSSRCLPPTRYVKSLWKATISARHTCAMAL